MKASLLTVMRPELILILVACALFIVGVINKAAARRVSAVVAALALLATLVVTFATAGDGSDVLTDPFGAFRISSFATFVKSLSAAVGILLVLLAYPTNAEATGNSALDFGTEAGEFFALLLLAISGIFVVAGANDLVLLFLGVELASIPTYIMVSVSRPLPAAQEAGVKYFFLGAMSAAVMLFGFSYIYGTTGITSLSDLTRMFGGTIQPGASRVSLSSWQMLGLVMLIAGFGFKMAAVPMHVYAGDVYQGAATPVTALLSYVPKASGLVALLKLLFVVGGSTWAVPTQIGKLIWIIAVLSMTAGNVLGLIQRNVKRVLAYSSIAHSGYMLVGVATLVATTDARIQESALKGVLFYLASYGIMNAAAFGVLMMLPAKPPPSWDRRARVNAGGSAETFDDLAGAGIRHPVLGLAMAVSCFSLIGLPLTVGFFGKLNLIRPALNAQLYWLVVLTMVNAAISAAYYLKIVATMFLRPERVGRLDEDVEPQPIPRSVPVLTSIGLSCAGVLLFGIVLPMTEMLQSRAQDAAYLDVPSIRPGPPTQQPLRPNPANEAVRAPSTQPALGAAH